MFIGIAGPRDDKVQAGLHVLCVTQCSSPHKGLVSTRVGCWTLGGVGHLLMALALVASNTEQR